MQIFLSLLQELIPLYGFILIGYIANKYFGVKKDSIAKLLLYILLPIVGFTGILTANLSFSVLSLPFISFTLCSLIAGIIFFLSSFLWKDGTKNMLAVGIANGNFGFIGIPLAIAIFGKGIVAPVALFGLGSAIFVATLGMYIAARANYSFKESIIKILKMPLIYAFVIGFIINISKVPVGEVALSTLQNVITAYTVLGLMLLGIAMGELGKIKLDIRLMTFTTFGVYILWPLIAFLVIFLDQAFFKFYNPQIYKILLLMSIVPVGASIVAVSTELKVEPEKASFIVLFTTLISLIYIPVFIALFIR